MDEMEKLEILIARFDEAIELVDELPLLGCVGGQRGGLPTASCVHATARYLAVLRREREALADKLLAAQWADDQK